MAKKKKTVKKKGKIKRKKRRSSQLWKLYKIEGNKIIRTNAICPKCGNATFLAKHKDRYVCGKCGYMEKI